MGQGQQENRNLYVNLGSIICHTLDMPENSLSSTVWSLDKRQGTHGPSDQMSRSKVDRPKRRVRLKYCIRDMANITGCPFGVSLLIGQECNNIPIPTHDCSKLILISLIPNFSVSLTSLERLRIYGNLWRMMWEEMSCEGVRLPN